MHFGWLIRLRSKPRRLFLGLTGHHREQRHKKRTRRRFRRRVRLVVGLILLAAIGVVVLTQGPVPRFFLRRYLAANFGSNVDTSWVSLKTDGRIVLSDLVVNAPGVEGPAGRVLLSEAVEVELDWPGWRFWEAGVSAVRVFQPTLRLSQSVKDGRWNIAALTTPSGGTGGGRLPRVDLIEGKLLFGEDDPREAGAPFQELAGLGVTGWIAPRSTKGDDYVVQIKQTSGPNIAAAPDQSLTLSGRLNMLKGEGKLTVSSIDLAGWGPERVPRVFRENWQTMDMHGQIAQTVFEFRRDNSLEADLRLSGVSLHVPVALGRPEVTGGRTPLMENVSGNIRFVQSAKRSGVEGALEGQLEDLAARVTFHSDGLSLDSPYSAQIDARGFRLEKQPRLLWLTPPTVQTDLEEFSGPTALVDALITIQRGAKSPERPSGLKISGSLTFTDGVAAYQDFPYPLSQLAGTVAFEDDQVTIRGITGRGPTGASVLVVGELNENAAMDVRATLTDLPWDDVLLETLRRSVAAPLIDELFNPTKYAELMAAGLVSAPGAKGAAGGESGAPAFSPGGKIKQVVVAVTRPFGEGKPISRDIRVRFDRLGLLTQEFPYPVYGEDVELRLIGDEAVFQGRRFEGLGGGELDVYARVKIEQTPHKEGPDTVNVVPRVTVNARRLPIGPLLVAAIPGDSKERKAGANEPTGKESLSAREVISRLGLSGAIDCQADVFPRHGDKLGYEVQIAFDALTARVPAADGKLGLAAVGLTGSLLLTDEGVRVDEIEGDLFGASELEIAGEAGPPRPDGSFRIEGESTFESEAGRPAGIVRADATVASLNLETPIERLLSTLSPELGGSVTRLRDGFSPAGRLDLDVSVERATPPRAKPGAPLVVRLAARNAEGVMLDAMGGRLKIDQSQGAVVVATQTDTEEGGVLPVSVRMEEVMGRAEMDGDDAGEASLSGAIQGSIGKGTAEITGVIEPVHAGLTGVRFESELVRKLLVLGSGKATADAIKEYDPRGTFDAAAWLEARKIDAEHERPWRVRAEVRPRRLAVSRNQMAVWIPTIRGAISVDEDGGEFDGLTFDAATWQLTLGGGWRKRGERDADGWRLETTASGTASGLTPSLLSVLPEGVRGSIVSSRVRVDGGFTIDDGVLRMDYGGGLANPSIRFDGTFEMSRLSAYPGVDITECDGTLGVRVESTPDGGPARVELDLSAPTLLAAGLLMTDARADLVANEKPGEVALRSIYGQCYGGRLSGTALVTSAGEGKGDHYEARLEVAGVRLANVILAMREYESVRDEKNGSQSLGPAVVMDTGESTPAPSGTQGRSENPPDMSRGQVDGEMAISGVVGDEKSRVGRGSMRVFGGEVLGMPFILPLVELSNLQIPSAERLDYFHASYFVDGNTVTFDELGLLSRTVAIAGEGTIKLPAMDLNLLFNSQSRVMRLPLLSSLFEGVRNEIVSTRVTGTLSSPRVGAEPFLGTRNLIGTMFGGGQSSMSTGDNVSRLEREYERSPFRAKVWAPESRAEEGGTR